MNTKPHLATSDPPSCVPLGMTVMAEETSLSVPLSSRPGRCPPVALTPRTSSGFVRGRRSNVSSELVSFLSPSRACGRPWHGCPRGGRQRVLSAATRLGCCFAGLQPSVRARRSVFPKCGRVGRNPPVFRTLTRFPLLCVAHCQM